MNNYAIKAGTVDVSVVIRIIDSTDGTPETGVVFNTSGIDLEYRRELEASTDITEATLAALTTAHTDGGFLHIGNGYYRLDLPDAACAAGKTGVMIHGTVTGMVVIGAYIQLVAYDPFDTVRLGLTALPNAVAGGAAGVPVVGTGANNFKSDASANVTFANTSIATATAVTTVNGLAASVITAASIAADAITAAKVADGAIDAATFASGAINAAAIATDAITAAKIANGAIDAATFAAGAIDAAAIATDAITAAKIAANAIGASELAADAVTEIQAGLSTLDAAGVRTAVGLAAADLDTQLGALPTAGENADSVWDEALAGHLGAGSTGNALNAAGAAGDPWSTAIPGAYGAGTAGKILGDNVNATISSRATPAQVATELATYDAPTFAELDARTDAIDAALVVIDDFLDTEVAAIKAKTDQLAFTVGGQVDSNAMTVTASQVRVAVGLASANLDTQLDALPTATENADALLNRDMSAVSDTTARSPLNAMRFLRNRFNGAAGTLTVYKENDTTVAWTGALSTDPAAEPITGNDPA